MSLSFFLLHIHALHPISCALIGSKLLRCSEQGPCFTSAALRETKHHQFMGEMMINHGILADLLGF